MIPLSEEIDDILVFHLTYEFPLNRCNLVSVQIFITHFVSLLVFT